MSNGIKWNYPMPAIMRCVKQIIIARNVRSLLVPTTASVFDVGIPIAPNLKTLNLNFQPIPLDANQIIVGNMMRTYGPTFLQNGGSTGGNDD